LDGELTGNVLDDCLAKYSVAFIRDELLLNETAGVEDGVSGAVGRCCGNSVTGWGGQNDGGVARHRVGVCLCNT